jgi:hypothetical protein
MTYALYPISIRPGQGFRLCSDEDATILDGAMVERLKAIEEARYQRLSSVIVTESSDPDFRDELVKALRLGFAAGYRDF